ncbi:MAG: hypothetical protein ACTSQ5_04510 [Promethearchaeota archaeon]
MKHIKHKHSLIIFTFILLFSFNSIILNTNAQDEEILSLGIRKNVGTAFGDKIEGTFTISGSGPDSILNLTLFFNGTQVAFESDNQLSFRFDTKDYSLGLMNITLVGEDGEGMVYTVSISKEFISPAIGNWIIAIVGGIALISGGLKLASYIKNKRNEKQNATDKKNNIKIDIDKEFL